MKFFKKKDNRYNNQIDSYTGRIADSFKLGLIYAIIGGLAYLIYKLFIA